MFVKGWQAFLTCFWFAPVPPVDGNPMCILVDLPGAGGCTDYEHIRYNGSLLACSHMCVPDLDFSCYRNEWTREPCLVFHTATLGRCYGGVCYNHTEYNRLAAIRRPNTQMPCRHGNDYLYSYRGPFGCHFYCRERPHRIEKRPDGNACLDPATAVKGGCSSGYCYAGYQRN
ncbi:uncharacterized protein LOC135369350 [Ornithodoros turicata]|uniref:uncharacterized protein LOC135369350 n=1 Tax=Ornithodoros turicata TaxID=34597 RepID=UPI003139F733